MKKYRVYELAKDFNIDSKVIIDKARELGVSLKSHASSVTEEEKNMILSALGFQSNAHEENSITNPPETSFTQSELVGTAQTIGGSNVAFASPHTISTTGGELLKGGAIIRRKRADLSSTVSTVNPVESKQDFAPNRGEVMHRSDGESPVNLIQTVESHLSQEYQVPDSLEQTKAKVKETHVVRTEHTTRDLSSEPKEEEEAGIVVESDSIPERGSEASTASPIDGVQVQATYKPPIKVLGKIEVRAPTRSGSANLHELFEQPERTKEEPVKKPLRFREVKSFVPSSPAQAPLRIDREQRKKPPSEGRAASTPLARVREIKIDPIVTVGEFASALNVKASDVISKLLSYGETKTINDYIDQDTMSLLAEEYNVQLIFQSLDEREVFPDIFERTDAEKHPRPPVVVVMGHVDHGKTTLLDAIRETNVAAREAGGITQHIGAYTVNNGGKTITFLDTPGHEAFTEIRSRGAKVTDIAVLVVAADDGVMPQTLEAYSHAKGAGVPVIVAVNKIDKPEANPEAVKTRLAEEGLVPEEWGGETMYVPVSALKKMNIDKLLDAINLLAEILDLKAAKDVPAKCYILEAKQERGRGWVATIIPTEGTLKVGDVFVCGSDAGRVRTITGPNGEQLKSLEPGFPGEISGFSGPPQVGDELIVVGSESRAKELAEFRKRRAARMQATKQTFSLEEFSKLAKEEKLKELRLILKTDTHGSCEALTKSLSSFVFKEVSVKVIHSAVGTVTESDVKLAKAAEAIIIAFNVSVDARAASEAESKGIEIRKYKIIYECLDDIRKALEGMLETEIVFEERGTVEVRQVFPSSKHGNIAGCFVTKGIVRRSYKVKVLRGSEELFFGNIKSLRRFKDDVSEVQQGYECGIVLEGFDQFKEGDVLLVVEEVERKKSLE